MLSTTEQTKLKSNHKNIRIKVADFWPETGIVGANFVQRRPDGV